MSLNPLDRKAKLKALRESWAKTCNARLDETARIDHRSLEDQGSDLEPTIHEGYAARAIERAGGVSERCQTNREIRRSNSLLTAIRTELGRIFDRLGELFAAKIRQLRQRQARPEPAREPNWRYFEGDARRQLEADRADHTAAIRGKLMGAKADVRNREEWWRSHGTEEHEAAKQIIDVARAARARPGTRTSSSAAGCCGTPSRWPESSPRGCAGRCRGSKTPTSRPTGTRPTGSA